MGVGLSASPDRVNMMEADAVIAWIDQMIVPHAEDYYLSGRFQVRVASENEKNAIIRVICVCM